MARTKHHARGQFTRLLAKRDQPCYVCSQQIYTGEDVYVLHTKGGPRLHLGCRIKIMRSGNANRRRQRSNRRRGVHS